MRRRGLLAEIQHQVKVARREQIRLERKSTQEYNAAVRSAGKARKAEERALLQAQNATEANRKNLEKEAKAAHVKAMESKAEELNSELAEKYDELETLLASSLDVDDYVDLESLRVETAYPPFDRKDLSIPIPTHIYIEDPEEPIYIPPIPPKGLFGKKRKLAIASDSAQRGYAQKFKKWKALVSENACKREALYSEQIKSDKQNSELDSLIANIGHGKPDAVQEYISIVLSNSVYPRFFSLDYDFNYVPETAEISLHVTIPAPSNIPTIKVFKYRKSSDRIITINNTQKVNKDRYAGIVHQVSLRTLHEVFYADRRSLVKSISLTVGCEEMDPATGNPKYLPFVAVAADRERFLELNLEAVTPEATLVHFGASISKNPCGLITVDGSGLRKS